jgi:thiamine biosynthesis lipoprotein
MLWPKPPLVEHGERSSAGSAWVVEQDKAVLNGPTMGATFTVVLAGTDFDLDALGELQAAVDAELQAVDVEMSTYREDSELSRFNRSSAGQWFAVSAHLLEVIEVAKQVSEQSGGAFDVTVAPLVELWGFGPNKPRELVMPSEDKLAAVRAVVGNDKLEIDRASGQLRKTVDGLRVDLSAIAPGHAADRLAVLLDAAGWTNYMVEIGGEVRVRGSSPRGEAWKVGIERPTADATGSRAVHSVVGVRDANVATSGDYRNYWELDGVRYSHTIDPRTGRPITHALASVTVVHPESAALADAWATALNVLGPDEGLALAGRLGLPAYFLVRTADGFESRATPAFSAYVDE